jgi:quinol monooxygenase YgiN
VFKLATFRVRADVAIQAKLLVAGFVDAVRRNEPFTRRYETWVEEDGVTFVHLMEFEDDEAEAFHRETPHVQTFVTELRPLCEEELRFTALSPLAAYKGS